MEFKELLIATVSVVVLVCGEVSGSVSGEIDVSAVVLASIAVSIVAACCAHIARAARAARNVPATLGAVYVSVTAAAAVAATVYGFVDDASLALASVADDLAAAVADKVFLDCAAVALPP